MTPLPELAFSLTAVAIAPPAEFNSQPQLEFRRAFNQYGNVPPTNMNKAGQLRSRTHFSAGKTTELMPAKHGPGVVLHPREVAIQ